MELTPDQNDLSAEKIDEEKGAAGAAKFESKAVENDVDRLVLDDSSSDVVSRRSLLEPEAIAAKPLDDDDLSQGSQVSKASKKRKYAELKKNLFGGLDRVNSYAGEAVKKRVKPNTSSQKKVVSTAD